jgi:hypothetical protein
LSSKRCSSAPEGNREFKQIRKLNNCITIKTQKQNEKNTVYMLYDADMPPCERTNFNDRRTGQRLCNYAQEQRIVERADIYGTSEKRNYRGSTEESL